MQKAFEKNFLLSGIIASEFVALNCPDLEENTCHPQSMC